MNDKSGVYDLHGNLILEVEHDYLTKLDIGYWHSRVDRKYALYSPDGRRQTEHKYDYIGECYGNLLTVKANGKEGVINLMGKEIVPAEYDKVSISKQGHYVVLRRDWKYGLIDSEGREICPLKYDSLGYMDEQTGMAAARIGCNHGYVDTEGKEIIPLKYADTGDFHLGFAVVQVHGSKLYGVINAKGEEVMPIQYTDVCLSDYVNEELRIVKIYDENKVGIFDLLGSKELIAPRYADVGKYSEGWLAVKSRGKWGFVDKEEYPLKYEWLK